MKKKIGLFLATLTLLFVLTSCGPNNVPVEWVDVTCSSGEIYVGDYVDLNTTFIPSNATDQGYTISIDDPLVVGFTGPLQVQGLAPGMATITIVSDDGGHDNTCQIYVTNP